MYKFIILFLSIAISATAQIVLKYGANKSNAVVSSGGFKLITFLNLPNVLGLSLYALSAFLWMLVLRKVELSYAYPMVSIGYVFIFLASFFLFHEQITMTRIFGLSVIIVGILIISRS